MLALFSTISIMHSRGAWNPYSTFLPCFSSVLRIGQFEFLHTRDSWDVPWSPCLDGRNRTPGRYVCSIHPTDSGL